MSKAKNKNNATSVWRTSAQLGVKAQLTAAINRCTNGAEISLDIKSAQNLQEVCDQAIHTEEGHGQ